MMITNTNTYASKYIHTHTHTHTHPCVQINMDLCRHKYKYTHTHRFTQTQQVRFPKTLLQSKHSRVKGARRGHKVYVDPHRGKTERENAVHSAMSLTIRATLRPSRLRRMWFRRVLCTGMKQCSRDRNTCYPSLLRRGSGAHTHESILRQQHTDIRVTCRTT